MNLARMLLFFTIVTVFAFSLSACSGDKTQSDVVSTNAQSDVASTNSGDKTPPDVVSTNVAKDATGVEPSTPLSITFSENLAAATVNLTTLMLAGPNGPVTGNVSISGNTVAFKPTIPLALNSTYTATLKNGIQDDAGNALTSDYSWSFSTRDGAWKDASLLIDNARNPLIGADGNGNMIAIWVLSDGLYSSYFDVNLGWGAPQKIVERTTQNVFFTNLHLAVNAKGDAVAAWVHEEFGNYFIQTVKYSGSGWGTPQQLPPPNAVFSLDVALDASSNAMIVWEGWDFPVVRHNIFASRSLQSSGWDAPQPIGTNLWDAQYPRIAIDNTGNAFALWAEGQFGANTVYVNRYTINSGWGSAQQIANNSGSAVWATISFDKTGYAMAVWSQSDSSNQFHIYSCRYVAGSGWGRAVVVDSNTLDSIEPAMTVDSAGNFRAVWTQFTGTSSDVYSSLFIGSSGWGTPQLIGTGGNARSPRVASDGIGNVFAAWRQYDPTDVYPGDAKVYANRYSAGWGTQLQLKTVLN
jgi:hypothetical protein